MIPSIMKRLVRHPLKLRNVLLKLTHSFQKQKKCFYDSHVRKEPEILKIKRFIRVLVLIL